MDIQSQITGKIINEVDKNGNPSGGYVESMGLQIQWQKGPLGRPDPSGASAYPNGTFVDTVLNAALQRLQFYQTASKGKFACRENALAITKIEEALHWLLARRIEREARGVQGLRKP